VEILDLKTLKTVPIEIVVSVEEMPPATAMEFGKLYHCEKYRCTNHLCLCGCGVECFLPLGENEWQLTVKNGRPTMTPSIQQLFACRSHYIITNGKANFV
jgi:hypothetical protein